MKVEVRSYSNNPAGNIIGTWSLDKHGKAVCDDAQEQEFMESYGVIAVGETYYPKDGEAFLRNIPYQYITSSFVRAVVIE